MKDKPYRCRGSYQLGTACANVDLPEGVEECVRCKARNFGSAEKEKAIKAEVERTKDLPADRVKKTQQITLKTTAPIPTQEKVEVKEIDAKDKKI